MNQTDFESYIDNPALLDVPATALIKGILEEYPFCQMAHLLYARNLKNLQHIAYSSQLRVAAAYAGNRGVLKNLLQFDPAGKPTGEIYPQTPSVLPTSEFTEHNIAEVVSGEPIRETGPDEMIQETERTEKETLSKQEIINRFIEAEPQITRPQKEFFNPVNYARLSAVDSETIVSETLARIFLKQGHPARAIKVYQKLSLVFPEKSAYFAALIEKIEKEHN